MTLKYFELFTRLKGMGNLDHSSLYKLFKQILEVLISNESVICAAGKGVV